MKPLLFIHLAALFFARCVVGEVKYDTDALDRLSDCPKTCISEVIAASNCSALDDTCLCTDETILPAAGACVIESCSVKQTLSTQNATQFYCLQPVRNKTPIFINVTIVFGTLTGIFILFRFGTKLFVLDHDFGMDDLFVLIAFLFGIPSTVMNIHGTAGNGEGQDIWNLEFDKIYKFGFWFYILEVFYFAQVSLLKMAFLFFYLRIFSGPAQKVLWGTIIFNTLYGVVFVFVASFQCTPVSFFWNGWDGEHAGKCLNTTAIGWANASVSVALDLWMLAVPLWCVRSLNMHWKKKLGVAFMFFVGTFVTVVSIIRLQFIINLGSSHNATYDQLEISVWSTVEINVGIMCTCMPSIRLLLVRFFPALKSTIRDTRKSSNYRDNSRPRSKIPSRDASKVFPENGIELKRTFKVQYTEGDEARLVGAQQMGSRGYTGSRTSVSEGSL
ncbi:hypothetical protein B0J13DRAFT_583331 [Dactylonectria estremocensis]|uniref:CFEM domain-containing protein n=1 Tax=Dactylonectria estremocensis TaxID=1079267 RepID=A0A9P9F1K7_9HYPO|nr:hypothetical protein B0J13DRAFT_583331 [Dactylonectria estremocensis]